LRTWDEFRLPTSQGYLDVRTPRVQQKVHLLLVMGAKNVMLLLMLLMSVSCTHVYHKVTDHRACYALMVFDFATTLLLKEHT
jgi:hypothetical protein